MSSMSSIDYAKPTVRVHISIPPDFLELIDQAALRLYMSRSSFVRYALLELMQLNSIVDLRPASAEPEQYEYEKYLPPLAE